ncbi:hypothetical protein [Peptostreptococcus canis]|uniref:DUF1492 domain-containing protein n=1 Tax=Peptostreptococcus canis TaxID=1159213 RepID=A0ABR6TMW8_9FIRM|nr:hypothetical protein [Peptostreptococcus canis]MBC2576563.1 hypothetical protein [Peptostreptococcus canis]MBP1998750.1 hypothetical protein [Peptostreptococcus canis]
MVAKEYLQKIYKIDENIKTLEDELLELDTLAKGCSISYNEKVQTSCTNATESIVCKIADTKSLINDLIRKKLELILDVNLKLCDIDDNLLETLLIKRYISCESWEKISVDLNYSIRAIYKLHGKALLKFQDILDKSAVKCS